MATLHGNPAFSFTGNISNISAYTMRGHDKIILRSKGGASKRKIKTAESFEATRRLNDEWKGVTKASTSIRLGLWPLKALADYNISGPLNALVKKIQSLDSVNRKGERAILFSKQPEFLSSFNYNRQTLFDTVIRQPFSVDINKSDGICELTVPALQPAINFFPNPRHAYYQIVLAFAAISDYEWHQSSRDYFPVSSNLPQYEQIYTPWMQTNRPGPSSVYRFAPSGAFTVGKDMILLLGAGVQYGIPGMDGSIQPAPYAGVARIIRSV
ncbi:MAG: hypothetical protein ACHQET_12975 [Chitinophagales bacterium]